MTVDFALVVHLAFHRSNQVMLGIQSVITLEYYSRADSVRVSDDRDDVDCEHEYVLPARIAKCPLEAKGIARTSDRGFHSFNACPALSKAHCPRLATVYD